MAEICWFGTEKGGWLHHWRWCFMRWKITKRLNCALDCRSQTFQQIKVYRHIILWQQWSLASVWHWRKVLHTERNNYPWSSDFCDIWPGKNTRSWSQDGRRSHRSSVSWPRYYEGQLHAGCRSTEKVRKESIAGHNGNSGSLLISA